jgi:hypothetical protein
VSGTLKSWPWFSHLQSAISGMRSRYSVSRRSRVNHWLQPYPQLALWAKSAILMRHGMVPSMSRPYVNASCESCDGN